MTVDSERAHLDRLEAAYHAAPTNRFMPAQLRLEAGRGELRMEVRPDYVQAVGDVHGMLYFKVLDEVSFYAANTMVDDVFLTTASMHLQFVAPLDGDVLLATANVVHTARSSVVADGEVRDESGRLLARSTGTFVRTKRPLPPCS